MGENMVSNKSAISKGYAHGGVQGNHGTLSFKTTFEEDLAIWYAQNADLANQMTYIVRFVALALKDICGKEGKSGIKYGYSLPW